MDPHLCQHARPTLTAHPPWIPQDGGAGSPGVLTKALAGGGGAWYVKWETDGSENGYELKRHELKVGEPRTPDFPPGAHPV